MESDDEDATNIIDNSIRARETYLEEAAIYKVNLTVRHPDDYPVFLLTKATVHLDAKSKGTQNLANVLVRSQPGNAPVTVRGVLEVDEDNIHLLQKYGPKDKRTTLNGSYIKLANVKTYSISWDPRAIWCSSISGWFEIEPSEEYQPVYDQMLHAIGVHFVAVMLYEEAATSKLPSPNLADIVSRYNMTVDGTGLLLEEFCEICYVHIQFLKVELQRTIQVNRDAGYGDWTKLQNSPYQKWLQAGCPSYTIPLPPKTRIRKPSDFRTLIPDEMDIDQPDLEMKEEEKSHHSRARRHGNGVPVQDTQNRAGTEHQPSWVKRFVREEKDRSSGRGLLYTKPATVVSRGAPAAVPAIRPIEGEKKRIQRSGY